VFAVRSAATIVTSCIAVVGSACTGDGDGAGDERRAAARARADQVREVMLEAGYSEEVGEVGARLAAGPGATYRAVYESTSGSETTLVTVTNDPPRRRVDIDPEAQVSRTTITEDTRTVTCTGLDDRWTCVEGAPGPELAELSDAALTDAVLDLARAVEEYVVAIEEQEVAGVAGTCLVVTPRADVEDPSAAPAATVCVSRQGIPLLVERAGTRLRAVEVTDDIPSGAFDPPAEISPDNDPG